MPPPAYSVLKLTTERFACVAVACASPSSPQRHTFPAHAFPDGNLTERVSLYKHSAFTGSTPFLNGNRMLQHGNDCNVRVVFQFWTTVAGCISVAGRAVAHFGRACAIFN